MKKNALLKLLAVSVAATLMFTGCGDNSTPSNATSKTTESTAKTTESTAKTTESTAKEESKESEAKTEEKTADVTVNDLEKTVYVTKLVNARVHPQGNADKAGILKKGMEVKVTGITADEEWYRIDIDGTEAYCQVANFSDEAPAQ